MYIIIAMQFEAVILITLLNAELWRVFLNDFAPAIFIV